MTLGAAALALLPPLQDRLRARERRAIAATAGAIAARRASTTRCGDDDCPRARRPGLQPRPQAARRRRVVVIDRGLRCRARRAPTPDAIGGDAAASSERSTSGVASGPVSCATTTSRSSCPLGRDGATTDRAGRPQAAQRRRRARSTRSTARSARPRSSAWPSRCCSASSLATTLVRRLGRLRRAALRRRPPRAPARRARATTGRDEVGDLARAFAAMQGALRAPGGGAPRVRGHRVARAAHAADLAGGHARAARRGPDRGPAGRRRRPPADHRRARRAAAPGQPRRRAAGPLAPRRRRAAAQRAGRARRADPRRRLGVRAARHASSAC